MIGNFENDIYFPGLHLLKSASFFEEKLSMILKYFDALNFEINSLEASGMVVVHIGKLDVLDFKTCRIRQNKQLHQWQNKYNRKHCFISKDLLEFLLDDE